MIDTALLPRLSGSVLRMAVPLLLLAGCSTLGIRTDSRPEAARARHARILADSQAFLSSGAGELFRIAQSRGMSREERLSGLLSTAQAALPGALKGGGTERQIYNAAVGQVVTLLQEHHFTDRVVTAREQTWNLETVRSGKGVLDPVETKSLVCAANVRIKGLNTRSLQPGIGVPYVFSYAQKSLFLDGQPGISSAGLALPATAVLTFKGSTARLCFQDPLWNDHCDINRHRVRLAADFSAPIAVLLSRGANRSIDLRLFLFSRQKFATAGLYQFQPYDPRKIPVIFVHGLLARPDSWALALNGLMADPEIRHRYQFWFLHYPTGLPIWKSAALLRSEMDRFQLVLEKNGRNPNLHRIILIGHSMGGVISSFVIRQGGDKLWNRFFDTQVEKLDLSPDAEDMVRRLIYFPPRSDISRIIFVATPHRGSPLAVNPVAEFFARLIQLPRLLDKSDRSLLVQAADTSIRHLISNPVNSIRFLRANSPLIEAIGTLPLAGDIPYHSIIGDRGRGDSPGSSDGVVPYWSSHLDHAASEAIVPSGHGANENPEAIAEMQRILLRDGTR